MLTAVPAGSVLNPPLPARLAEPPVDRLATRTAQPTLHADRSHAASPRNAGSRRSNDRNATPARVMLIAGGQMTRTVFRWILNVIASAGVAVTIVVGVWQFLGPPNVPAQVLAIILLTAIYPALLYAAEPRPAQMQQVALERGSAKFARYYADFYSQEGAIRSL